MKWAGWRVHTSPLTRLMLCRFPGLSSRIYILFLSLLSLLPAPFAAAETRSYNSWSGLCVCEVVMCLPGKKKK